MDKHHENKLTMYLGVKSVLEENKTKTDTVVGFAGPLAKYAAAVAAVENKSKQFDLAITGKVQVKADAEEALIDELMPAICALAAYAHSVNDTELLAKASVPESTFQRMRDTEIVTRANGQYELLEKHAPKLVDLGVTAETLKSLRGRIDAYESALGKKESGYSDRSSARKVLFDLFDEVDIILTKQIDLLMQQFRKREVEFYNAYFDARLIRNMGAARKAKAAPEVAVSAK